MQNDEKHISEELEQMRLDYDALKEDLKKQKILNDRIMKNTLKKSIGVLGFYRNAGILFCILMIPFTFAVFILKGIPLWIPSVLSIIPGFYVVGFMVVYKDFGTFGNYQDNVLETTVKIRCFKKKLVRLDVAGWILAIAVLALLLVPIYRAWSTPVKGLAALGIVFVAVSMLIYAQIVLDRRLMKTCDDVIRDLEAGSEDEPVI